MEVCYENWDVWEVGELRLGDEGCIDHAVVVEVWLLAVYVRGAGCLFSFV